MAITAGTTYSNTGTVSTSGTVTMTTVDANSVVLLTIITDDSTGNAFSTPTATGLTFVQIGSTVIDATWFRMAIWRAYTASSLGSTLISSNTWTESVDWLMTATDFTGTAGTAGNNGSDAIGTTNTATNTGNATSISVTVNSSSHDQSKYFGAIACNNTAITKGANYTNCLASLGNGSVTSLTQISTSPVSPAANTAVNATMTTGNNAQGVFGIELLAATTLIAGWKSPTAGPSYAI